MNRKIICVRKLLSKDPSVFLYTLTDDEKKCLASIQKLERKFKTNPGQTTFSKTESDSQVSRVLKIPKF